MSTISHEPSRAVPERGRWSGKLRVREMWAAPAITVMWLAVLFAALFGPDIVSTSAGASSTTVPSAVAVALLAFLATRAVANTGSATGMKTTDARQEFWRHARRVRGRNYSGAGA